MNARPRGEQLHWAADRLSGRPAVIAIGLLWLLAPGLLAADGYDATEADSSSRPRIVGVQVGFDGHFKIGHWTPLFVTASAGSESLAARLTLIAPDGDATPTQIDAAPGELAAKIAPAHQAVLPASVKLGQRHGAIRIELRDVAQLLDTLVVSPDAAPLVVVPADRELILLVGSAAASDIATWQRVETTVVRVNDPARLPDQWWGYDAVDAVVLSASDPGIYDALVSQPRWITALDEWVRRGGRLIFFVSRTAPAVLAAGAPLARFAPGDLVEVATLRQSTEIDSYAEASESLKTGPGPFSLPVARLSSARGHVEAFAGNQPSELPLVVRTPRGFGEVVFVPLELDRAPLADWSGSLQLTDRLLRRPKFVKAAADARAPSHAATLGYSDLAGQLRAALDQFSGVAATPFWLVAVLIAAFIVCVAPLDYYLVHHLLKRPEATWITFGLWVALFGGGAWLLAGALKGHTPRVNQVDVVDIDVESGMVRGTSWANLMSPKLAAYDLGLSVERLELANAEPPAAPQEVALLFSWFGLPGMGFGGMSSKSGSLELFTEPYDFRDNLSRLEQVPIATWSSKAVVGRWTLQTSQPISTSLPESTRGERGRLSGSLANPLGFSLYDGVLLYDRWAYPFPSGPFESGEIVDIDTQLAPQTIETFLRQVRVQGDRSLATAYDPAGANIARILQIASTYELAGGQSYTGLSNEYQRWLDLSQLVRDGRAVLLARAEHRLTQLQCDGSALVDPVGQESTYVRLVIPVHP